MKQDRMRYDAKLGTQGNGAKTDTDRISGRAIDEDE